MVRQAMIQKVNFIDFESYAPKGMAPVFLVNPVLRSSLQEEDDWQAFIKVVWCSREKEHLLVVAFSCQIAT